MDFDRMSAAETIREAEEAMQERDREDAYVEGWRRSEEGKANQKILRDRFVELMVGEYGREKGMILMALDVADAAVHDVAGVSLLGLCDFGPEYPGDEITTLLSAVDVIRESVADWAKTKGIRWIDDIREEYLEKKDNGVIVA